jgi:hypothetical protein
LRKEKKMVQHLRVYLSVSWKSGDDYQAEVETEVLDTCYKPKSIKIGLPPGMSGLPEMAYVTAELSHEVQEGQKCGEEVRKIKQHVDGLHSPGKQMGVTAFVLVDGQIAGHDWKPFPR